MRPDQIAAVAFAIVEEREAHHPEFPWQRPGVESVVRDLAADGMSMATIVAVGQAAAADVDARTPLAMTFPRYQRLPRPEADVELADIGPICTFCSRSRARHDLAEAKVPPAARHPFTITRRSA